MKYQEMKNELKAEAKHIRNLKSKRKKAVFGYVEGLDRASFNFRCKHISYCILKFNKTINEIERKVRDNDPNCYTIYQRDRLVKKYLEKYKVDDLFQKEQFPTKFVNKAIEVAKAMM